MEEKEKEWNGESWGRGGKEEERRRYIYIYILRSFERNENISMVFQEYAVNKLIDLAFLAIRIFREKEEEEEDRKLVRFKGHWLARACTCAVSPSTENVGKSVLKDPQTSS